MIEKLIALSVKNRFLVLMSTLFLIVGSIWAMKNTPLDEIPMKSERTDKSDSVSALAESLIRGINLIISKGYIFLGVLTLDRELMDRRDFFKFVCAGTVFTVQSLGDFFLTGGPDAVAAFQKDQDRVSGQAGDGLAHGRAIPDQAIKDRLVKVRFFDRHFRDDVCLKDADMVTLQSSLKRLKRIQRLIGYGNFCLVGLDDAVTYARSYSRVGRFTRSELAFLEKIFYSPARDYGFMGEKPIETMTERINPNMARKIPGTGNYLYRGRPEKMYGDIRKKIGEDAVLTSGIRGVMKQFLLFLNKAAASRGNLSMASRSLAPPGYSFHGIGDFDVGEKGFGIDNFTEKFTQTRVYNQLSDLGYIKFRYDRKNNLGVRFEPWHVEVG